MIVKYKGYTIDVKREKCMAGYPLLYYAVYTPDGEEIICSFEDSAEKVRDMVGYMKNRVDEHIENPDAYKSEFDEGSDGEWVSVKN